jgi:hypothetical protein
MNVKNVMKRLKYSTGSTIAWNGEEQRRGRGERSNKCERVHLEIVQPSNGTRRHKDKLGQSTKRCRPSTTTDRGLSSQRERERETLMCRWKRTKQTKTILMKANPKCYRTEKLKKSLAKSINLAYLLDHFQFQMLSAERSCSNGRREKGPNRAADRDDRKLTAVLTLVLNCAS